MLDLGWSEIALIVLVAVVVLGPKELPRAMRTAGQWIRKLRLLAGDFQRHLDDMVQEAELAELRDKAKKLSQTNIENEINQAIDPDGTIARGLSTPQASYPSHLDPTGPSSPSRQGEDTDQGEFSSGDKNSASPQPLAQTPPPSPSGSQAS